MKKYLLALVGSVGSFVYASELPSLNHGDEVFISSDGYSFCFADPDSIPEMKVQAKVRAEKKAQVHCSESEGRAFRLSEWNTRFQPSCSHVISASFMCVADNPL